MSVQKKRNLGRINHEKRRRLTAMTKSLATAALLAALLIMAFVIGVRFSSSAEGRSVAGCGDDWHVTSASASDMSVAVLILIDECNRLVHWMRLPMGGKSQHC